MIFYDDSRIMLMACVAAISFSDFSSAFLHGSSMKKLSHIRYNQFSFDRNSIHFASSIENNGLAVENRNAFILEILNNLVDPDSGLGLVEAKLIGNVDVSKDGIVNIALDSIDNEIRRLCTEEISALPWVQKVDVTTSKKMNKLVEELRDDQPVPSNGIKHIIAVSSCKGGVGKSTVSVNLAYTLQQAGAKVGILDADIYGPSLPTMTTPTSTDVVFASNKLKPLEYEGVKLMSMGFINKGAAIMRGPMVNQILNQFVSLCDWGELDYLILDMPPGTGDIQLTLAQIMNISAAVIVTTPQRLSFVDVVKGIDLFDTVNVPCVAVVENMAAYSTYTFSDTFYDDVAMKVASSAAAATILSGDPSSAIPSVKEILRAAIEAEKRPFRVFGDGHNQRLRDMWGIENLLSLPLLEEVSRCGDKGRPYVLAHPASEVASVMRELATGVVKELMRLAKEGSASPTLEFEPWGAEQAPQATSSGILRFNGETALDPWAVRCSCRCAVCVEEFTGRSLLSKDSVPKTIKPNSMMKIGRYAVSVDWSDGHKSLFPYRQITALAEEEQKQK